MKIKRSSLICKIAGSHSQDNLCRFFWRLIGHFFLGTVMVGLTTYVIYCWIISPDTILILIVLFFCVGCVVFPVLAIVNLRRKVGGSPELPYENIVFEYLKAKKQKVCPLIEYVD